MEETVGIANDAGHRHCDHVAQPGTGAQRGELAKGQAVDIGMSKWDVLNNICTCCFDIDGLLDPGNGEHYFHRNSNRRSDGNVLRECRKSLLSNFDMVIVERNVVESKTA